MFVVAVTHHGDYCFRSCYWQWQEETATQLKRRINKIVQWRWAEELLCVYRETGHPSSMPTTKPPPPPFTTHTLCNAGNKNLCLVTEKWSCVNHKPHLAVTTCCVIGVEVNTFIFDEAVFPNAIWCTIMTPLTSVGNPGDEGMKNQCVLKKRKRPLGRPRCG
jgi:hypothetical protein